MIPFLLAYPKLIYQPRKSLQTFADKAQSGAALIILLLTLACSKWLTGLTQDEHMQKLAAILPFVATGYGQVLFLFIVTLFFEGFQLLLLHVTAALFDGKGQARSLWTCLLAILTLTSLVGMLPIPHINWITTPWSYILTVVAVRTVYGLSWEKSIVTVVIDTIGLFVGILIFALMFGLMMVPLANLIRH